jgi:hypothetical protein
MTKWSGQVIAATLLLAIPFAGCWRMQDPGGYRADDGTDSATDTGSDVDGDSDSGSGSDVDSDTVDSDSCTNGVWEGDANLISAATLAQLVGYTEINGNCIIDYLNDTTSIDELACLERIHGMLEIAGCASLVEIDGLSNLEQVGVDVSEDENENCGDSIHIAINDALENVDGLAGLTELPGRLLIRGNYALTEIDGLAGVTAVAEEAPTVDPEDPIPDIEITDNDELESLDGLAGLTAIGFLHIEDNDALTDLSGLENLTGAGTLAIMDNAHLDNLEGLASLTLVEHLVVSENSFLPSLDGLDNLESAGNVKLAYNHFLADLSALSQLTEITGWLMIAGAYNLESLAGLENLAIAADGIALCQNTSLVDISALYGLEEIGGSLGFKQNEVLPTCDVLDFIAWLEGDLGWDGDAEVCGNLADLCEAEGCSDWECW